MSDSIRECMMCDELKQDKDFSFMEMVCRECYWLKVMPVRCPEFRSNGRCQHQDPMTETESTSTSDDQRYSEEPSSCPISPCPTLFPEEAEGVSPAFMDTPVYTVLTGRAPRSSLPLFCCNEMCQKEITGWKTRHPKTGEKWVCQLCWGYFMTYKKDRVTPEFQEMLDLVVKALATPIFKLPPLPENSRWTWAEWKNILVKTFPKEFFTKLIIENRLKNGFRDVPVFAVPNDEEGDPAPRMLSPLPGASVASEEPVALEDHRVAISPGLSVTEEKLDDLEEVPEPQASARSATSQGVSFTAAAPECSVSRDKPIALEKSKMPAQTPLTPIDSCSTVVQEQLAAQEVHIVSKDAPVPLLTSLLIPESFTAPKKPRALEKLPAAPPQVSQPTPTRSVGSEKPRTLQPLAQASSSAPLVAPESSLAHKESRNLVGLPKKPPQSSSTPPATLNFSVDFQPTSGSSAAAISHAVTLTEPVGPQESQMEPLDLSTAVFKVPHNVSKLPQKARLPRAVSSTKPTSPRAAVQSNPNAVSVIRFAPKSSKSLIGTAPKSSEQKFIGPALIPSKPFVEPASKSFEPFIGPAPKTPEFSHSPIRPASKSSEPFIEPAPSSSKYYMGPAPEHSKPYVPVNPSIPGTSTTATINQIQNLVTAIPPPAPPPDILTVPKIYSQIFHVCGNDGICMEPMSMRRFVDMVTGRKVCYICYRRKPRSSRQLPGMGEKKPRMEDNSKNQNN